MGHKHALELGRDTLHEPMRLFGADRCLQLWSLSRNHDQRSCEPIVHQSAGLANVIPALNALVPMQTIAWAIHLSPQPEAPSINFAVALAYSDDVKVGKSQRCFTETFREVFTEKFCGGKFSFIVGTVVR